MATITMPSADRVDKAYKDAIGRVASRYEEGIKGAKDVKEKMIAGQKNYEEKMSDAAVLARRKEKLEAMPETAWRDGALEKGKTRIGPGMQAGAPKRKANYEVIRQKLDGLTIADKTTDADTNIDNRLKPVVKAMQEAAGKR
ncbi:unnamed protein product [marine sediment metagenome]|uniref:Uncharacterized protein n=1 Tax=marine sediment metagenome TaxID=412755 RepID=X0VYS8_9ZZZZ